MNKKILLLLCLFSSIKIFGMEGGESQEEEKSTLQEQIDRLVQQRIQAETQEDSREALADKINTLLLRLQINNSLIQEAKKQQPANQQRIKDLEAENLQIEGELTTLEIMLESLKERE